MKKTGFTLIELVLYLFGFVVISLATTLFILQIIQTQAKLMISKQITDEGQRAMETMLWEIKQAKNVYLPTTVYSTPGQLSLETEANPVAGETSGYLDFYLDDNNRLCLKREGQAGQLLTSEKIKVEKLDFTRLVNGSAVSIKIYLQLSYNSEIVPLPKIFYRDSYALSGTAALRND